MTKVINRYTVLLFLLTISLVASAQKDVRKYIREGNKSYEEKLYNAAEANYNSALKSNEASPEALYNLGNTYYQQGKWDEALKTYEKYLTVQASSTPNPLNMSQAWHNMGNTFLHKKDLEKSKEAYKNALRLNPADDQTRYNLAVVQKMIQDQKNDDQNQDQNKDQNKDQQDQNKDQNKDQQDQNQDQNQDKKDQDKKEEENQMSQDNIQQLLKAIEQDEKETQERVKQMKANDRKKQNENNRKLNKDW